MSLVKAGVVASLLFLTAQGGRKRSGDILTEMQMPDSPDDQVDDATPSKVVIDSPDDQSDDAAPAKVVSAPPPTHPYHVPESKEAAAAAPGIIAEDTYIAAMDAAKEAKEAAKEAAAERAAKEAAMAKEEAAEELASAIEDAREVAKEAAQAVAADPDALNPGAGGNCTQSNHCTAAFFGCCGSQWAPGCRSQSCRLDAGVGLGPGGPADGWIDPCDGCTSAYLRCCQWSQNCGCDVIVGARENLLPPPAGVPPAQPLSQPWAQPAAGVPWYWR